MDFLISMIQLYLDEWTDERLNAKVMKKRIWCSVFSVWLKLRFASRGHQKSSAASFRPIPGNSDQFRPKKEWACPKKGFLAAFQLEPAAIQTVPTKATGFQPNSRHAQSRSVAVIIMILSVLIRVHPWFHSSLLRVSLPSC